MNHSYNKDNSQLSEIHYVVLFDENNKYIDKLHDINEKYVCYDHSISDDKYFHCCYHVNFSTILSNKVSIQYNGNDGPTRQTLELNEYKPIEIKTHHCGLSFCCYPNSFCCYPTYLQSKPLQIKLIKLN